MEFNEKLQELRKQRGLTQEALAQHLHVSRAAISKWESGRGYPNIDSLKATAKFFCVTVDDLLSGDELLTVAEEAGREKSDRLCDLVFGLLDVSSALFLFLPLFAQRAEGVLREVSLLELTGVTSYLRAAYFAFLIGMVGGGILMLALQSCRHPLWMGCKRKLSLGLGVAGTALFMISLQPNASFFLFVFLIIKVFLLRGK